MRFFTSDVHISHKSILFLGKGRPWDDIDKMNQALIDNINSRVGLKDELWVLGDFAYRNSAEEIAHYFNQIKTTHRFLLIGNHDQRAVLNLGWRWTGDYKEMSIDGNRIMLSHYPSRSWNKMYSGSYHLFGHEHGNIQNFSHFENNVGKGGSCDVGVDAWNYFPASFPEILERIKTTGVRNPDLFDKDGNDRTRKPKQPAE